MNIFPCVTMLLVNTHFTNYHLSDTCYHQFMLPKIKVNMLCQDVKIKGKKKKERKNQTTQFHGTRDDIWQIRDHCKSLQARPKDFVHHKIIEQRLEDLSTIYCCQLNKKLLLWSDYHGKSGVLRDGKVRKVGLMLLSKVRVFNKTPMHDHQGCKWTKQLASCLSLTQVQARLDSDYYKAWMKLE